MLRVVPEALRLAAVDDAVCGDVRDLVPLAGVGLLLPQTLWVVDFILNIFGIHLTGMTDYMFKHENSLFLRGLSLFHGWLPFLLIYLVWRMGYDRRALAGWTALAIAAILVCFFFMPGPRPGAASTASSSVRRSGNWTAGPRAGPPSGARPGSALESVARPAGTSSHTGASRR